MGLIMKVFSKKEFTKRRRRFGRPRWWIVGTLLTALLLLIGMNLVFRRLASKQDLSEKLLTTTVDPTNRTIKGEEGNASDFEAPSLQASLWNAFEMSGMRAAALQTIETIVHPGTKVVVVYPGLRKEEIAELFAKKLSWNEVDKRTFAGLSPDVSAEKAEGYFFPDTYYVRPESSTAEAVHDTVVDRFNDKVRARYATSTANLVNVELALKIASIIQREAAGKHDMAIISGVIWNRLFKDMTLDMDATLQYAKGNAKIGWWPRVASKDKYIDSPYNTYKYGGLPPTPISSPSLAAINAALNPKKTDAYFYLHDRQRRIHTARTYKQHLGNINRYY